MSRLTPGARRAVGRIAWRDARRNRWRALLVISMIAVPVAAVTTASIAIATSIPTAEQRATAEMGAADLVVYDSDAEFGDVVASLPPGSTTAITRSAEATAVAGGTAHYLNIVGVDLDDPVFTGKYLLVAGNKPVKPGELALEPSLLEGLGLHIGDRLAPGELGVTFTITGAVIEPESLGSPLGITAPGTLESVVGTDTSLYVRLPAQSDGGLPGLLADGRWSGLTRADAVADQGGTTYLAYAVALVVTVVALGETGLVAAAAFVVGARRQLRTLGLVGAAGGDPAQVRGVVLASGVTLGLVGSLAGLALGTIGGVLLTPLLDRFVHRVVGRPQFPLSMMAAAVLLGTVAATFAAWVPARAAARIPTVDALARRTPPPAPAGRWAGIGLAAIGLGAALLAFGTIRQVTVALTIGVVGMLAGVLLAIPLAVGGMARLATRLPVALRIAGRDTGRHGRRTAAAVAATTLALGFPVAVSAMTLSDEARFGAITQIAPDHLEVGSEQLAAASGPVEQGKVLQEVIDAVATQVEVVAATPMTRAAFDSTPYGGVGNVVTADGGLLVAGDDSITSEPAPVTIGGAELLRALHAEEFIDELNAGHLVVLGSGVVDDGMMYIDYPPQTEDTAGAWERVGVRAVESGGVGYDNLATAIVSPDRAAELGLIPGQVWNAVIRTIETMEGDALAQAKQAAATVPGGSVNGLPDTRVAATGFRSLVLGFSAAVALATIGVAVALVAAESRRDQAVLAAVGASPGTARKVVASGALLLAALAAALAVPAGFLPVAVLQIARPDPYPVVVPWQAIAVVVLVVPLVAAAIAAAVTRRPSAAHMLRPIE